MEAINKRMEAINGLEEDAVGSAIPVAVPKSVPADIRAPSRSRTTPILKTPQRRDKRHLRLVATRPCLVCGRTPSDPHHVRYAEPRTLGRKVSDDHGTSLPVSSSQPA